MRPYRQAYQRGVAVITALLLTTLAITIVASLFWQQQVEVRSMENQRLNLQTRWILRGALDWSSVVLRQDAIDHRDHTALTHVWATPLAETRLDRTSSASGSKAKYSTPPCPATSWMPPRVTISPT